MSITRVITDIPGDRVAFVTALIEIDGGRVTGRQAEDDGEVTLVARYDDAAAPPIPAPEAQTPQARWMAVAERELDQGVAEDPGGASNPRIEQYHATTRGGAAPDSVHWCSSFVNFCVTQAGVPGTDSKLARSWMEWGREADGFTPGCIVVLQRGAPPKGHVGFFAGTENGRIRLLGGNQGDRVSIVSFEASQVLARRLPA